MVWFICIGIAIIIMMIQIPDRRERVSTKHPAARGWELAISTNPELVCRHGWRQWRTTAGPFSSFLGSVNTAEGDTGGDPVMVITSIIQQ